jgi:hypothetical protein
MLKRFTAEVRRAWRDTRSYLPKRKVVLSGIVSAVVAISALLKFQGMDSAKDQIVTSLTGVIVVVAIAAGVFVVNQVRAKDRLDLDASHQQAEAQAKRIEALEQESRAQLTELERLRQEVDDLQRDPNPAFTLTPDKVYNWRGNFGHSLALLKVRNDTRRTLHNVVVYITDAVDDVDVDRTTGKRSGDLLGHGWGAAQVIWDAIYPPRNVAAVDMPPDTERTALVAHCLDSNGGFSLAILDEIRGGPGEPWRGQAISSHTHRLDIEVSSPDLQRGERVTRAFFIETARDWSQPAHFEFLEWDEYWSQAAPIVARDPDGMTLPWMSEIRAEARRAAGIGSAADGSAPMIPANLEDEDDTDEAEPDA